VTQFALSACQYGINPYTSAVGGQLYNNKHVATVALSEEFVLSDRSGAAVFEATRIVSTSGVLMINHCCCSCDRSAAAAAAEVAAAVAAARQLLGLSRSLRAGSSDVDFKPPGVDVGSCVLGLINYYRKHCRIFAGSNLWQLYPCKR
jgi:hypothetical protein